MEFEHWNTAKMQAAIIIAALVVFVVGLAGASWLVGGRSKPAPVPPVLAAPAENAADGGSPAVAGAAKPAAAGAGAVRVRSGAAPPAGPAVFLSPGGNPSIALPVDEDPAHLFLPAFISAYPGARTISCNHSGSTETSVRGAYVFTTPDLPDVAGAYYREQFTNEGLVVSVNIGGKDRQGISYTLIADGGAHGHSVSLRIDYQEGRSHGSLGFVGN